MVSATHIYKFDAKHTILFTFQFSVFIFPTQKARYQSPPPSTMAYGLRI